MGPLERVDQMTRAFQVGQLVHAGAILGLYDVLDRGAMAPAEVAAEVSADPVGTRRLMRALAATEVLAELGDGCFVNTELGELLCEKHPRSARSMATMRMDERLWRAWGALPQAVRTGEVSYRAANGGSFWADFADDPARARRFNALMVVRSQQFAASLIEQFDFQECRHIVDVGGGSGAVLAAALAVAPDAIGTVFDLESGLVGTDRFLSDSGVLHRCNLVAGSFFESVPGDADVYILRQVLHDWPDDQAIEILSTCRRAMTRPGARLLVSDIHLAEHAVACARDEARFLQDMNMFVMFGTGERTESEFRALLSATGFSVGTVLATSPEETIVAVPS
jgi:2-polyprenyl-3-methyl-5-hydroxy-6-metoxy-1,4-benzoquinol methylase